MTQPLVTVEDVSRHFGDQQVLEHVSLSLHPREIITLIGPNGSGKTTLARIVLGLLAADSGTVTRQSGLRMGYMPQHIRIDETFPLTVDRFLWLAEPGRTRDRRAALERTGVAHLRKRPVQQLSGGEMQRVLLARALLRKPDLLVLDEPAQGVDVAGQGALYELLGTVRDELGCGILLISHDLHLVMAATDQVVCLHHHVCCHGTPEAVSRDPAFHNMIARPETPMAHLALYRHEHDHDHDLHGQVQEEPHD